MKSFDKHITYIWQRPDWPDFYWDSEALLTPLAKLSHLHGMLAGQMSMIGFGAESETRLKALTEELINSSAEINRNKKHTMMSWNAPKKAIWI